jgi:S1-C subfamily serine protease
VKAVTVALLLTLASTAGACSPAPDPAVTVTTTASTGRPTPTATPSPTPSTLTEARAAVQPAVARLTVTKWQEGVEDPPGSEEYYDECSVFTGTGFAVSENLLVTAAHVVEDRDRIRVTLGTVTTPGEVVGYDRRKDVALIRIERKAPTLVSLAERAADVGNRVATLGYAETLGLSYLEGGVNRLNTKSNVSGNLMTGLTEVDFATKGGNSGGPVFDATGGVVGILVAGPSDESAGGRMVVPTSTAAPLIDRWRAEPDSGDLSPTTCTVLPGDAIEAGTTPDRTYRASVHSAALTLVNYIYGVNTGDYKTAFAQLAKGGDYDEFVDGVETSNISNSGWTMVQSTPSPVIDLDFDTSQDKGEGPEGRPDEECTAWHLRYTFVARDGIWLINKVRAQPDEPANEPCFEGDAD